MIFIERYPLKRCRGCVKLIASKVNCFLNITDLSEVQLSSNSWTWECPHTKHGADHVPLIFLSSVYDFCIFACYRNIVILLEEVKRNAVLKWHLSQVEGGGGSYTQFILAPLYC